VRRDLGTLPEPMQDLVRTSLDWMDERWDPEARLIWMTPDASPLATASRHSDDRHDVRGSSWYALGLLLRNAGDDAARAVQALSAVLDNQYTDGDKPYFGTFARAPEEPTPPEEAVSWRDYDPNWRQFIGTTLAMIIDEYASELPRELVRRMDDAIMHAVAGEIAQGRLSEHYANIALMKAPLDVWAGVRYRHRQWIVIGENWAREIHRLFSRHGAFEEYNSPTYYGPDLFALGFWRHYAPSRLLRTLGSEMEETLWRDIGRLYHAGLRNQCGPYVRAYGMDMTQYVAVLGQAIWAAVGPELAPHPRVSPEMGHPNDLTYPPCLAMVGVRVPEDVLLALCAFPGGHTVEQIVMDEPPVVATAWLADTTMLGGLTTGGTRSAGRQLHPATAHWRLPDGGLGWLRLVAGDAIDATASERRLEIRCSGNAAFQVYAPGAEMDGLSSAQWMLPGLAVQVTAEADEFSVEAEGPTLQIVYRGCRAITLSI
jgi:hypothetical protein